MGKKCAGGRERGQEEGNEEGKVWSSLYTSLKLANDKNNNNNGKVNTAPAVTSFACTQSDSRQKPR